jgi:spore cortex formation protein SpoVR/YcgB (stage V sporulation)
MDDNIDAMVIARDAALAAVKELNPTMTTKQIIAYSAGFNDGWHNMTTFRQQDEMAKLVEMLARMDTPTDGVTDEDQADDIMADLDDETLCSDANALYELIEAARAILKGGRK